VNEYNLKCILHSEYDVLAQSFLLLQEYITTPEILHVKGHQDVNTPYRHLPLPAQLNCNTDSLATTELRSLPNQIRRVPLFPPTKAQLLILGQSVTRNSPNAIGRSYGYHRLIAYGTRFQWTKTTVDSIDWDGFSAAFRSCFKQRNFAFKLCSRLLPTGKNLQRNEARYDHRCPACNKPQECNHHLFQCTAVSHQRWRNKTTSSLRKRLDAITDPRLSNIMTAPGLCSYFQSKPLDCSKFEEYNATYHNLITLQELIGWDHLLRGKLSKEWANPQQDYVYRTSPGKKFDKEKWLRLIIKPLIMDYLDLWTLWNEEQHGNDLASKQLKLANQARRDLRAIYLLLEEVLASDRDLFSKPLEIFLQEDTYSIQCWIRSHKQIIYRSRRKAKRNSVTNVRLLSTYSILFQVDAPNATRPITPPPHTQPHLRSTPIPTTISTHPPFPQPFPDLISKIKSSFAISSSFP
jgi:hypothetical protein